jgi:hypothetical protein
MRSLSFVPSLLVCGIDITSQLLLTKYLLESGHLIVFYLKVYMWLLFLPLHLIVSLISPSPDGSLHSHYLLCLLIHRSTLLMIQCERGKSGLIIYWYFFRYYFSFCYTTKTNRFSLDGKECELKLQITLWAIRLAVSRSCPQTSFARLTLMEKDICRNYWNWAKVTRKIALVMAKNAIVWLLFKLDDTQLHIFCVAPEGSVPNF